MTETIALTNQESTKTTYLKDYTPPSFFIKKTDLIFDLKEEKSLVTGHFEIEANVEGVPQNNLILDGEKLILKSIVLDNKKLDPSHYHLTDKNLIIKNVPAAFSLTIQVEINPKANTALNGLYLSSGNFCTQCEPHGFRHIIYYLDRPDVMSRFTTTIIADAEKYPILLSNGNLIEKGKSDNNRHWVQWEDPFKKPSYLFALVAGDLEFVEDKFITQSGRSVSLKIFVEKGNQDKCAHAMQAVKKAMRWDEEKFGREYDLDIYMIVAVSDFNMGAMENKGLNIFNTKYILAKDDTATDMDYIHVESVIAHEYFHNWTGNRITCRDWFQLSLKEGLTIFRDQSFTADTTSKTVARIHQVDDLRNTQFPEDASPMAHAVRPDSYIEMNNFYTATVYNKGAEVIRMMQTLLGEEKFRAGMDLYFSRHDGQAVTTEEFVKAMEDASQKDLTQLRVWYVQAGTPHITVTDEYDSKSHQYTLNISQSCPATPGQNKKEPFHIPIKMGLIDPASGKELHAELLELTKQHETFIFRNITVKPIPSLLRSFSAPVRLKYCYTLNDLISLMEHDTDLFNRWEAGQRAATEIIINLIHAYRNKQKLIVPEPYLKALAHIAGNGHDKLFTAEMLVLPSEKILGEELDSVDVDAIYFARQFLISTIAKENVDLFLEVYERNQTSASSGFSLETMAKRRLKNVILNYLVLAQNERGKELALDQFKSALKSNMTDTQNALKALLLSDYADKEILLQDFFNAYQDDQLVVDKWFALQAESPVFGSLETFQRLLEHPAFDIKNPNKVYALIGTFTHRNLINFHVKTGEGYELLSKLINTLDGINPQIAARMVKPLISWRRYDNERQELMKNALHAILAKEHLSNDVYELVSKSLNEK